jgi:hypothetical protein
MTDTRRLSKSEMRQRGRELRALLNEWNPIGIPTVPAGDDEYDCLLWPLIRMLEQDSAVDAVAAFLTKELRDHFGLDHSTQSSVEFARRAKTWFQSS